MIDTFDVGRVCVLSGIVIVIAAFLVAAFFPRGGRRVDHWWRWRSNSLVVGPGFSRPTAAQAMDERSSGSARRVGSTACSRRASASMRRAFSGSDTATVVPLILSGAVDGHAAAVQFHQVADDGQAQPQSAMLTRHRAVLLREPLEDMRQEGR